MSMIVRLAVVCAIALGAEAKLALLVGINDYSATGLRAKGAPVSGRDWPDLPGPVNDVETLAETLVTHYGFERGDILTLTNQQATRDAILSSIERHLIRRASRDDVVLFYFAGHGSQVRNSLSDERDQRDESLIPADSLVGAADIRDKELRPLFNRILDRGARLTVILDNCHSGSGARGRVRPRGLKADLRDVAARSRSPRPEDRGALVLSAAEDHARAWDMRDDEGNFRGVFSWALLRAIRDAAPGEPAEETFLRAHARMKSERLDQEPVMAGNAAARRRPLFGIRIDRDPRTIVAISKLRSDGTVILQGGWAHGLTVGAELRVDDRTLTVEDICGPALSVARPASPTVRAGALAEVVHPAVPQWHTLPSPSSPYRLHIRDTRTNQIAHSVTGNRRYDLIARPSGIAIDEPHYLYAFVIDSAGKRILLLPRHGSVENRFTQAAEIPLARFKGAPPYGTDTYFLLTTDTPLPNPWILQSDGVRAPPVRARWSLERISIPSVPR